MTDYPAAVQAEQQAEIELHVMVWRAAHCPEHERFEEHCFACQVTPQNCPAHTPVPAGESNPVNWCVACQRLRPDPEDHGAVAAEIVSTEEALKRHGLPLERSRRGWLRVPWKEN